MRMRTALIARGLHKNVGQYTRSGPAPARNTARGETAVGVMFLHDAVAEAWRASRSRPSRRARAPATRSAR